MNLTITIRSYCDRPPSDDSVRSFIQFPVSIGRANSCAYYLEDNDRYISSIHAIVSVINGQLIIHDTSSNGVYVNGSARPIGQGSSQILRHGDTLGIGEYVLMVAVQSFSNVQPTKHSDIAFVELITSPTRIVSSDSRPAYDPFRVKESDWTPQPTGSDALFKREWELSYSSTSSEDRIPGSDGPDWTDLGDDVFSAAPFGHVSEDIHSEDTRAMSRNKDDSELPFGIKIISETYKISLVTYNQRLLKPEPTLTCTLGALSSVSMSCKQKVEFAVFAPLELAPNSSAIIDVWAFTPKQYDSVKTRASFTGDKINIGQKSGVTVDSDEIVTVKLEARGLVVEDPFDTITWSGSATNASFIVRVSSKIRAGDFYGKALIIIRGITIAKVVFLLTVSTKPVGKRADRSRASVYLQSAFASYASADREEVLARIQGMRKIAPGLAVFVDVLSLRSGEQWKKMLSLEVTSKDVFFLFWSLAAARSKWVEREWRLALSQRGLNYINPVPLDEPSTVKPPAELSSLHFADSYMSYIQYERQRKLIATE